MNNFVRITSGKFRGRKATTPGEETHPMGERERLALFNMISDYLPGATVLDAFAGSGALGIEALSRGASEVTFIDANKKATECIRGNLASLGLEAKLKRGTSPKRPDQAKLVTPTVVDAKNHNETNNSARAVIEVICSRVQNYQTQQRFDLILADPPYDHFRLSEIEHLCPLLESSGILVLSHPGESPVLKGLTPIKSHKYAGATISIYK